MREDSSQGMLKYEMKHFGSIVLEAAYQCNVPAGGALAVDRDIFSRLITEKIKGHENIELVYGEVTEINKDEITIIATGPLTSGSLYAKIKEMCGDGMSFFDAAAPIVMADSIDMDKVFAQSRYDKGDDDYLNCPFNKEEYEAFYEALASAERAPLKDFEQVAHLIEFFTLLARYTQKQSLCILYIRRCGSCFLRLFGGFLRIRIAFLQGRNGLYGCGVELVVLHKLVHRLHQKLGILFLTQRNGSAHKHGIVAHKQR